MSLVSVKVASQTEVGSCSEISVISSPASTSLRKLNTLGGDPHSQVFKALSHNTDHQVQAKLLPRDYTLCNVEDMVMLIANTVSELIRKNDRLPLKSSGLTRFHSRVPPKISIADYLRRLARFAALTPPLLLSMVYYADQLCTSYSEFTVTSLTAHRFLITAATVAAKGLSDSFWDNETYAYIGGVNVLELGILELEFLFRVDWKIVPKPDALVECYRALVERAEGFTLEGNYKPDEENTVPIGLPL